MKKLIVLSLVTFIHFTSFAQLSIQEVQKQINDFQNISDDSYQVIEGYTDSVEVDDVIKGDQLLSSVLICHQFICHCYNEKGSFQRRYGLRLENGNTLAPIYNHIRPWGDNFLIHFDCGLKTADIMDRTQWMAIINPDFRVLEVFEPVDIHGGWYKVRKDGKYGLMTSDMYEYSSFVYEEMSNFSLSDEYEFYDSWSEGEILEDYEAIAAKKDGKWGIITREGHNPIPFKYDYLTNVDNGKAVAGLGGKWGIINSEDSALIDFDFDHIKRMGSSYSVKKGDKFGLMNYDLNIDDVEFNYDEIDKACHWSIFGRIGKLWYELDDDSQREEAFKEFRMSDNGQWKFFGVKKGNKWAIKECGGKVVSEFIYSGFKNVVLERKEDFNKNGRLIRSYPVYHVTMRQGKEEVTITFKD